MRFSIRHPAGGFTLVELMIAVGLLAMIFVVAGYIFQTSVTAIGQAQANNEMVMSLTAFDRQIRFDLDTLEHEGFLVIGRRSQQAYPSGDEARLGLKKDLRNDWMSFYGTTELASPVDPRAIGQFQRIFYGQGDVTNPSSSDYSNVATNWVLMRQQVLVMPALRVAVSTIEGAYEASHNYDTAGISAGLEWPQMGDKGGKERTYWRATQSYTYRRFYWWWHYNYGWCGSFSTPWVYARGGGQDASATAYYEPTFYVNPAGIGHGQWRMGILPHCAQFRVQYAMSEDLGTTIAWRDPPAVGDSNNLVDPNYNAADPLYGGGLAGGRSRTNNDGRLVFGPGDRWPRLLRINVHIYDPLSRLAGGRTAEIVIPVP
ncbi:MAG: hypothetical protein BIFFINMI_02975 [Phycisphaerae bacterium]|nr:hypothetical protein [Phycisphaerae bacterium]